MTTQTIAGAAAFVKTPGLTPLKTRLAQGIGREAADEFYTRSVSAVEAVLEKCQESHNIAGYWAVAEEEAADIWDSLPVLQQGEGELGARLHNIYSQLLEKHPMAIVIGGDCPHITAELILKAYDKALSMDGFAIGMARDGGFYILAGTKPVPEELWNEIEYSTSTTGPSLAKKLGQIAPVASLPERTDIDALEDLEVCLQQLNEIQAPLKPQVQMAQWLGEVLSSI